MRARPRTLVSPTGILGEYLSRMQTAALLDFPVPRRMASRPVDCMAETMADGDAVPVMCRIWEARSADMEWTPGRLVRAPETARTHASQWSGTAKVV